MQHGAAVAQTVDARTMEQVGVDARDLRRDVGTDAQRAAGCLVHQLEGTQIKILAATAQERFEMLEHGRDDQAIATSFEIVQQRSS